MATTKKAQASNIHVGVGGWTYEPWRDNFFPKGWPQKRELEYASRQLSAIEINGTYYSTQKRESFAKWRDETPDDFVFSMKASRFATNRKVLADAGDSIARFIDSGIAELKHKLGPVLWQFMPTKKFEAEDFEGFLNLLPKEVDGWKLRHVMDVRNDSFLVPQYLKLARKYKVGTVFTDSDDYPSFSDVTGDFVYARLMRTKSEVPTGYGPKALDDWARHARAWAGGEEPAELPRVEDPPAKATAKSREVFVFMISGAKERAPAAAMALLERLGWQPAGG